LWQIGEKMSGLHKIVICGWYGRGMSETLTAKRPWNRFEPKARQYHKHAVMPKGHSAQSDLDRRIDEGYRRNQAERYRSYIAAYEPSRIIEMLKQIDPEGKAPYGTRFVKRMLATQTGKRELERFINRALAIMDVENGLDVKQDFTDVQRDMLLNDETGWKPIEERIKRIKKNWYSVLISYMQVYHAAL
jgi:hypothetical protein